MNIDTMLESVIDNLNDCLVVGSEVKEDPAKGYPYAYGYSSAGIRISVEHLQTIIDQYRTLMIENNQ